MAKHQGVLLMPYWQLTQPMWWMHLAHTVTRHNASEFACDCTHFCYSPAFWTSRFFPALTELLRKSAAAASRPTRGRAQRMHPV
mmetsp:Transcript_28761/g.65146  ORF Transcript_28761/g.65146 Transcript_28761/m.65146 type:complete len:84 (+) Transcript_28761:617-868(+)